MGQNSRRPPSGLETLCLATATFSRKHCYSHFRPEKNGTCSNARAYKTPSLGANNPQLIEGPPRRLRRSRYKSWLNTGVIHERSSRSVATLRRQPTALAGCVNRAESRRGSLRPLKEASRVWCVYDSDQLCMSMADDHLSATVDYSNCCYEAATADYA